MTNQHEPAHIREHGPMEIPLRIVRLADQIAGLKKEAAWERGERAGKTLVKEGGLSAVLTLLRAGAALHEHQADGPVTIHCLEGRIELSAQDRTVELVPGDMAALDSGIRHSVRAREESAFLITLAQ